MKKDIQYGKKFKVNRTLGYSIMGEKPPKIDLNATYYVYCLACAYDNRPVIKRCDGKEYLGENDWIVDIHNLIEC